MKRRLHTLSRFLQTTEPRQASGAERILAHTEGADRLFFSLLYGTGMRLMEALRLRVKVYDQITVRDGLKTTMIYTHVLNRGGRGVRSPIDLL